MLSTKRRCVGPLVGLLLLLCNILSASARKNVLFIMVDDMRPQAEPFRDEWAFEVAPDDTHTPHITELAATGTTLTKTFCQVSLCGPSRTSLLTGRRPDTTKVYTNNPYWRTDTYNFTTFPQYFKENGYVSVGLGKIPHGNYDGGYDYPSWSYESGYDFYPPSTSGYWKAQNKNSNLAIDESNYNKDLMDRDITDKAKTWIQELKNQDFFMAIGLKLVHLPWVVPEHYFNLFNNDVSIPSDDSRKVPNDLPDGAFNNGIELRKYPDIAAIRSFTGAETSVLDATTTVKLRQSYYASVAYVDSLIGELIQELKDSGIYDDTIIVLTSDHGYHLGELNQWTKNTNFEIATQVPLIISAPQYRSQGARKTNKLVELVDVFPTLVDLAELPAISLCSESQAQTTQLCREGTSIKSLLDETSNVEWDKSAIFHQYARGNKMGLSIRTAEYRLTAWLRCDPRTKEWSWSNTLLGYELYDLTTDTYEYTNLASNPDYDDTALVLLSQLAAGWRDHRPSFDV